MTFGSRSRAVENQGEPTLQNGNVFLDEFARWGDTGGSATLCHHDEPT